MVVVSQKKIPLFALRRVYFWKGAIASPIFKKKIQLVSQYFCSKKQQCKILCTGNFHLWVNFNYNAAVVRQMRVFAVKTSLPQDGSHFYICSHWLQLFRVPLIKCWKMATESLSLCPAILYICTSYHRGPDSGSSRNAHVVYIMNVLHSFQKREPKTKDNLETGKQANHRKKTDQM